MHSLRSLLLVLGHANPKHTRPGILDFSPAPVLRAPMPVHHQTVPLSYFPLFPSEFKSGLMMDEMAGNKGHYWK